VTGALLEAHRLSRVYGGPNGDRVALADVSLALAAGELVGLAGPSGSGKTTLITLLGGLEPPTSGRATLDGQDVAALSAPGQARRRASMIGLVFQTHNLLAALTAEENVSLAVESALGPRSDPDARAREALAALGLDGYRHQRPGQLSLGEQQRVAVARAIAMRPKLLLADEPTASLDWESAARVLDALAALASRGCAVMIATHDERCLRRVQRTIALRDGRIQP
jgi:putative ABC transport system ATP-binding protein